MNSRNIFQILTLVFALVTAKAGKLTHESAGVADNIRLLSHLSDNRITSVADSCPTPTPADALTTAEINAYSLVGIHQTPAYGLAKIFAAAIKDLVKDAKPQAYNAAKELKSDAKTAVDTATQERFDAYQTFKAGAVLPSNMTAGAAVAAITEAWSASNANLVASNNAEANARTAAFAAAAKAYIAAYAAAAAARVAAFTAGVAIQVAASNDRLDPLVQKNCLEEKTAFHIYALVTTAEAAVAAGEVKTAAVLAAKEVEDAALLAAGVVEDAALQADEYTISIPVENNQAATAAIVAAHSLRRTQVLAAQIARRLIIWNANDARRLAAQNDAVAERLASSNSDARGRLARQNDALAKGDCDPSHQTAAQFVSETTGNAAQAAVIAAEFAAAFVAIATGGLAQAHKQAAECAAKAVVRFTLFSVHAADFGTTVYDKIEVGAKAEAAFCEKEFNDHYKAVDDAFNKHQNPSSC